MKQLVSVPGLFGRFLTFLDARTLTALVIALGKGDLDSISLSIQQTLFKIVFQNQSEVYLLSTSTTMRLHYSHDFFQSYPAIRYPLEEARALCDAANRKRRRVNGDAPHAPRKRRRRL